MSVLEGFQNGEWRIGINRSWFLGLAFLTTLIWLRRFAGSDLLVLWLAALSFLVLTGLAAAQEQWEKSSLAEVAGVYKLSASVPGSGPITILKVDSPIVISSLLCT